MEKNSRKSQLNNFPDSIKELKQWVLWRHVYYDDREKPPKKPFQVNGFHAKTNNSKTWNSFNKILEAYYNTDGFYDGIGFVFSDKDYVIGIDFDNCVKNGVINNEVQKWIDHFQSYTELSQSGKGIHILVKGKLPHNIKNQVTANGYNVEIYDKGRYFALTGDVIEHRELKSGVTKLNSFYNFYGLIDPTKKLPKLPKKEIRKTDKKLVVPATNHHEYAESFVKTLPKRPYGRNSYAEKFLILSRLETLQKKYIQLNSPFLSKYITIQLNNINPLSYKDKGLPDPTYIVKDQHSDESQLIYKLSYPVNSRNQKSVSFYNDVKRGLIKKLGGNKHLDDRNTLNPFFYFHHEIRTNKTYSVKELNAFLSREDKRIEKSIKNKENVDIESICRGNRNESFFDNVRKQAYQFTARNTVSQEEIYDYCISELEKLNSQILEPLPERELVATAKSISKYCFINKDKFDCKNRGAYKEHIDDTMSLKEKQRVSAKITNQKRQENKIQMIMDAIKELKENEEKITISKVNIITGISRTTITKYMKIKSVHYGVSGF